MAWEERGGGSYYYQKRRGEDGRVVSEYLGSGMLAQATAQLDEIDRERRQALRLAVRQMLAPIDDMLRTLRSAAADTRRLVSAHLLATGHRTHKGQWRRSRHATQLIMNLPDTTNSALPARKAGRSTMSREEEAALIERCNSKKVSPDDLRALRKWLKSADARTRNAIRQHQPGRTATLRLGGGSQSVLARELNAERITEVQDAYGWQEAPPPERVQIELVALAYLVLDDVQTRYGNAMSERHDFDVAVHYEKRLTSAQYRFNAAVESLERVRALKRKGTVYVNVAAEGGTFQQVNTGP